ncbi:MAG: hypothetical protein LBT48_03030 [Prevotellaceae bacterium]|nr:hypothetical protein [Prevotellaceae bacterium]
MCRAGEAVKQQRTKRINFCNLLSCSGGGVSAYISVSRRKTPGAARAKACTRRLKRICGNKFH